MDNTAQLSGLNLIQQYLRTEQGAGAILEAGSSDLVDALPFLLQLVNRQGNTLASAAELLGLQPEAVWHSVVRLLKHIYFAYPDDAYRVLGLNPWCQLAEARERHRHLIRLFHPDRGLLTNTADEPDFAAVINRAYTKISEGHLAPPAAESATGIRQHSQSQPLKAGRQPGNKLHPRGRPMHMAAVAAALGIYKLTPRSVWLALFVMALVFIAQNYWHSRNQVVLIAPETLASRLQSQPAAASDMQTVTPGAEKQLPAAAVSDAITTKAEIEAPDVAPVLLASLINPVATSVPADAKKNAAALKPPPAVVAVPPVETPVVKGLPKPDVPPVRQQAAKPSLLALSDQALQKPVQAAKALGDQPRKEASVEYQPVQKPAQAAVAVKAVNAPVALAEAALPVNDHRTSAGNAAVLKEAVTHQNAPAASIEAERKTADNAVSVTQAATRQAVLSNDELDRLMKALIASYNNGDIDAFTQLLEDDVKTDEAGGKNGLRQAYAKLFRKTTQREMQLKDFNWRRNGEVATTTSKYVVSITSAADPEPKIYRGVLQFEVVRREGRPMIHALYHLPEGNNQ